MGDLIQTSGELTINGGMLNVYGDYRLQKETINANGEIKYSFAYAQLVMKNNEDVVNIAGSFISRSDYTHTLTAGTMKIGGDIYDWGADIRASSSGTHKVILNGTGKQTVYFSSSSSSFTVLEATNTDIECTGYFSAKSLGSDITFTSNGATINKLDLNGNTLTINGDVETSSIDINGGVMTVNGTLRQTYDEMSINKGVLNAI